MLKKSFQRSEHLKLNHPSRFLIAELNKNPIFAANIIHGGQLILAKPTTLTVPQRTHTHTVSKSTTPTLSG